MFRALEIKICGLTREQDIDLAQSLGADHFGFIVYPKSPRGVSFERAIELSARVPEKKRVIVDVETDPQRLERYRDAGFGAFQIHSRLEVGLATLAAWSGLVGRERLWFAPRMAPEDAFPELATEFSDTILLDTYSKTQVGGTGETGDWSRFAELSESYRQTKFILAGGLSPENVQAALGGSGATRLDVNSGVESEPGIKNPEKLRELFRVLRPESDRA